MKRLASEVLSELEVRVARLERQVKVARSIPRPSKNLTLVTIESATRISDEALDKEYGYGLSKRGSFGYEANRLSATYALGSISDNMSLVLSDPDSDTLIEMVSNAVHDGWSKAAYTIEDPRYETQPEKRVARLELANTPYNRLSEGEKEKDRVIARALIDTVYMKERR